MPNTQGCKVTVEFTRSNGEEFLTSTCGTYVYPEYRYCDKCFTQFAAKYPQGWSVYPGDVCSHGNYVGGQADVQCGYCEDEASPDFEGEGHFPENVCNLPRTTPSLVFHDKLDMVVPPELFDGADMHDPEVVRQLHEIADKRSLDYRNTGPAEGELGFSFVPMVARIKARLGQALFPSNK